MPSAKASKFLETVERKGIELIRRGDRLLWGGPLGGCTKRVGPLAGKRIGCLLASEFSDFQAYYVAAYIGELGGRLDWLLVDRVTWHWTRPNDRRKGVQGLWGLSVDPIPVGGGDKADSAKSAYDANPDDYDALIILGGPSGDIMSTEKPIQELLLRVHRRGAVVGGIGGGILPLIATGLTRGKRCTGNEQVDYILKRTAVFTEAPCETDGQLVTARETLDTPAFVAALCRALDPAYVEDRQGLLTGKRMLLIAGWDFEDFEIAVPFLELKHRGADLLLGTFTGCKRSRPALLGADVAQGNFGMTVPLQEIPDAQYEIRDLRDIDHASYDGLMIPGAFCPWNMIEARYPIEFLRGAHQARRLIAFMCHGPNAVAAAGIVEARTATGWLSCTDAFNAMGGEFDAKWAAAVDGNLVSGRTTPELPEFIDAMTLALLDA